MGTVTFNNISTVDMGVFLQTPPVYPIANKDVITTHIEGRNGNIVLDKNSYQNVNVSYYMAIKFRPGTSFYENVKSIINWLSGPKGYARLEDSYDPEHYRLAIYKQGNELTNYQDVATVFVASFECKPQRYLKSGDTPIELTSIGSSINIINTTNQIALPLIIAEGVNLLIKLENELGNQEIKLNHSGKFTIDSEIQDCYDETSFLNNKIETVNGFPKLYSGKTKITITGTSLVSFKIIPRWWTL